MKSLFIGLFVLFCQVAMAQFTAQEKEIIYNGDMDTPFEVLLITNQQDSLFLRQKALDVDFTDDNEDLNYLIARMIKTMEVADGVGIAAPQIGISRNIFIFKRIDKPGNPTCVAINPKLEETPNETVCFEGDGCLSIPNTRGNSIRYPWVEVAYYTPDGVLIKERLEGFSRSTDFTGIIFQHEYDHLKGVLFIDKLYKE